MPVGGRVYRAGGVLNAWVNLPLAPFSDVLTLAMSGALSSIELTTEKLQRDTGDLLGLRFSTGQVRLGRDHNASVERESNHRAGA
jgi:hypothetical protein